MKKQAKTNFYLTFQNWRIARAFNGSINLLGEDFGENKILQLLTDAAPYKVKAANSLKVFYSKLIHVTCLVHGLHRVAE